MRRAILAASLLLGVAPRPAEAAKLTFKPKLEWLDPGGKARTLESIETGDHTPDELGLLAQELISASMLEGDEAKSEILSAAAERILAAAEDKESCKQVAEPFQFGLFQRSPFVHPDTSTLVSSSSSSSSSSSTESLVITVEMMPLPSSTQSASAQSTHSLQSIKSEKSKEKTGD